MQTRLDHIGGEDYQPRALDLLVVEARHEYVHSSLNFLTEQQEQTNCDEDHQVE